jgi:hypothetical protein
VASGAHTGTTNQARSHRVGRATLLACSPAAVASFLPAAAGPLVTVTTHETGPTATELGTVPAEVLSALDAAVKATDFGVIRSRPFTGACPVAFDGQEVIYEFRAPTGVERVVSCETEIDPDDPLFAAATAALVAAGTIPRP